MPRYIDAEALMMEFANFVADSNNSDYADVPTWNDAVSLLGSAPSADVVEVVRCKYCKWGREACGNIECFVDLNAPTEYHGYDWFCPSGERREDETDL